MGAIFSGSPINIIRLTYKNEVATVHVLENDDLRKITQSPLLSSLGVIEAIFYDHVIVTEGESDRAFYQEINERLLQYKPEWGIQNCLFISALNKHSIPDIIETLRNIGVSVIGITDIDVIKKNGPSFGRFLQAFSVPPEMHESMKSGRSAVERIFKQKPTDQKFTMLNASLTNDEKQTANRLFDQLNDFGLFVVRIGELEDWLSGLGVNKKIKNKWLINIFEKLGSDPNDPNYIKYSDDDVWEFIHQIKQWFEKNNNI